jgi:hypothetical protein
MGEVYRARDSRLGRDVAVKVLPASSTSDADRLQRFEQEARAAAALNHPNILALYDIGRSDAGPYLVTELLEGETLRAILERAAIPVRKAIDHAVQIARGLAAAHEKGIVHRDLKPENVFITSDGHAKILDFGLAKLVEPDPVLPGGSMVATVAPATTPGVVLGTVGYMSPEQVRGQQTDHRADIFAFGAVLYEMLSGRRAFHGETPAETMTAILREEPPDLSSSSVSLSPALQRVVNRCLEKNPAARFQSAGDLAFALDALSTSTSSSGAATPLVNARPRSWRLSWIVTAAALVALAAAAWVSTRPAPSKELIRFTFTVPEGWTLELETAAAMPLAVSPNGQAIALRALDKAGTPSLLVRRLDDVEARPLAGTVGVESFFWSPDSASIGFVVGNRIQRLDLAGGAPTVLGEAEDLLVGAWSSSGTILLGSYRGLLQVPATGGKVTTMIPLGTNEAFYTVPQFLSDGRRFTFAAAVGDVVRGGGERRLMLGSLGTAEHRLLYDSQEFLTPLGLTHGHFLYMRGNALLAQPYDEAQMKPLGEPVPLVAGVQLIPNRPYGAATVSSTGVLAYVAENEKLVHQLAWFDRSGRRTDVPGELADFSNIELSKDDKSVALAILDPTRRTRDIWIQDLSRGVRTRLTFDPGEERTAIWSPDSARVVYNSQRKGVERDLFTKMSNGSGAETTVLADGLSKDAMDISPDGRFLMYRVSLKTRNDIWIQPLDASGKPDGSGKPSAFIVSEHNENYGKFSPDGKWVAYTGDESGQQEVYVVPFPGPGGKWQVSGAGGAFPRWRGDGRELFYLAPDGKMMSVTVDGTTTAFRAEAPLALFHAPLASFVGYQYSVTKDGQRFLVNTAGPTALPVTVVSDWTLALKK